MRNELVGQNKLTTDHMELLKNERNLSEEEIKRAGYFTFPRMPVNRPFLRALEREGIGQYELKNVPGFFYDKEDQIYKFNRLADNSGIGIPIKNEKNQIVGIQIRKDEVEHKGQRYVWFSSSFADDRGRYKDGSSPGTPFDVVVPMQVKNTSVIITEGHFKAEAVAREFGCVAISVQGVGNWKGIEKTIENIARDRKVPVKNIIIAYDSDLIEKPQVLIQAIKLGGTLNGISTDNLRMEKDPIKMIEEVQEIRQEMSKKNEKEVYVARWSEMFGKGIDDVINQGFKEHLMSEKFEKFLGEMKEMMVENLTIDQKLDMYSRKVKGRDNTEKVKTKERER